MPRLPITIETLRFAPSLLAAWKKGDRKLLKKSRASKAIKKVVLSRARKGAGREGFGEAYVASKLGKSDNGWRTSFNWLSSSKWLDGRGLASRPEKELQAALTKHFGAAALRELQLRAKEFRASDKRGPNWLQGRSPAAPDLWVISKGEHRFISCKLGARGRHGVAGLRLIAMHLRPKDGRKVSVQLLNLWPEDRRLPWPTVTRVGRTPGGGKVWRLQQGYTVGPVE